MSSPAVSLQNSGLAAQTTATAAVVSVPDAPPEMAELPAGAVLPAVMMPTDAAAEMPVMLLTLPDGKELSVHVKSQHPVRVPTPVSIRILPLNAKKEMTVRVHFSAPLPDIKKAEKDMPEALCVVEKAPAAGSRHVLSVKAFVLRSVPEQITALMNELEDTEKQPLPSLKPDRTLKMELSPQKAIPHSAQEAPTPSMMRENTQSRNVAFEENAENPLPAVNQQNITDETVPFLPTEKFSDNAPQMKNVFSPAPLVSATSPQTKGPQTAFQPVTETSLPVFEQPVVEEQAPAGNPVSASAPKSFPVQPEAFSVAEKPSPSLLSQEKTASIPKEKNALPDVPAKQTESLPVTTTQTAETTEDILTRTTLKGITYDFKDHSTSLVVTKAGVLALEEKIQLPHLTPVDVRITEIAEPPVFAVQEQTGENVFGSLSETLEVLKQNAPPVYEAVKDILPQIGNRLPAQIFSFVHATSQSAPLTALIGEANVAAIQNLGEKGQRLLNQTEKEFSSSVKKATDGNRSWKSWSIPFLSGAVVEPVSLYLQKAPEDGASRQKGSANKPDAVRFVLDLNLTQLGKLQMDGLAHRAERRFDLIVRHNKALPETFDDRIRFIFTQTLTALNYTGTVNVDHTDQFITMTEEIENTAKRGVWA